MRLILRTGITALVCSVFFAAYEFVVLASQWPQAPYHAIIPILCLYSIPFFLSLFAALVLSPFLKRRDRETQYLVSSVITCLYFFAFLGVLVNIHLLPKLTSPMSLAGNAVFLGLVVSFTYEIYQWPYAKKRLRIALALSGTAMLAILVAIPSTMTSPTFADEARFAGEAGADAPNIVFVLIDTPRADHVSGLGYPRNTTPNIDAYAQQGVMFERAYSQSNWTPPSVASIFTSLIPEAHGAFGAREALPSDKPILTELLNANGYRTGIFADNPFVSAELGYSRGADTFYQANPLPFLRLLGIATLLQEPRIPGLMKLADFLTQEEKSYWDKEDDELVFANAYRFIDASSDRPYFAYAHIVSPHAPYEPPAEERRQFCPGCGDENGLYGPAPVSDEKLRALVSLYDGEIHYADRMVGAFLERALAAPNERNTLVIITSDHGESFADHGNFSHGNSLYEEEIRVPLVMVLPGVIAPGLQIDIPVRSIDIFPTILELAGIAGKVQLQGRSLVPVIADDKGHAEAVVSQHGRDYYCVIDGGYKLLKRVIPDLNYELYRTASDAPEKHEIQDPARISALDMLLRGILDDARQQRGRNNKVEWFDRWRDELKALGYVE